MRGSAWAYPLANILHLFGLALLAGGIMAVDARILGAWRRLPLAALSAALTPVAVAGLVLFALSGFAMFASDAAALVASPVFLAKLGVIGLALANALAFRRTSHGRLGAWASGVPVAARAMAAASLALWTAAIILGRMIAYS
jgi:hypothetical protein